MIQSQTRDPGVSTKKAPLLADSLVDAVRPVRIAGYLTNSNMGLVVKATLQALCLGALSNVIAQLLTARNEGVRMEKPDDHG